MACVSQIIDQISFSFDLNKVLWKWSYSFPYCGLLLFYSTGIDVIISIGGLHLGIGGYCCWSLLTPCSSWTFRKAFPFLLSLAHMGDGFVSFLWTGLISESWQIVPIHSGIHFTPLGPFFLPITLLPTSYGFSKLNWIYECQLTFLWLWPNFLEGEKEETFIWICFQRFWTYLLRTTIM